jgi:ADP-heptose:LPS heptosyltransferase
MRILCLSLLRLGDIIQHRQLVRAVMRRYPQAEIHLLCLSPFAQAQEIFSENVHFHFLPYEDLQKILVEQRQHPQAAVEILRRGLTQLQALQFSLIYDLTHTFLSDAIRRFLRTPRVKANSLWEIYLEDHATVTAGSRFHLMEVLARSLDLELPTEAGGVSPREKIILLQTLTSDQKKNWSQHSFQELVQRIQQQFADYQIKILSSPAEVSHLKKFFAEDLLFVCSLKQAQLLLKKAAVLISLDTSLLHLAAQENCPVVGLFLGGADPVKSGPLRDGSLLLQGKAECAPCAHSQPCSQAKHLCGQMLSVDQVFSAVQYQLNLPLSEKEKDRVMMNSEQVIFRQNAYSLRGAKATAGSLDRAFEEMLWRHYLDGQWQERLPCVNSQVRQFLTENSQASPEIKVQFSRRQKTLAGELKLCAETFEQSMKDISLLCLSNPEVSAVKLSELRQELGVKVSLWTKRFSEQADLFHRVQLALQGETSSAFHLYGRLKSPVMEFQCLTELRWQMADQLIKLIQENEDLKWIRPTGLPLQNSIRD